MLVKRRMFLTGLASALAAPAIVPYSNLMPVRFVDDEMGRITLWDGDKILQRNTFVPLHNKGPLFTVSIDNVVVERAGTITRCEVELPDSALPPDMRALGSPFTITLFEFNERRNYNVTEGGVLKVSAKVL